MNYVVQAKPDDLTEIVERFKKQEEAVDEFRQDLVRMNDRLKQGWIGLGSDAYFAEAERLVLPAVQRLAEALGEAGRMLTSVTDQFGAADREASSSFKEAQGGATQPAAAQQAGQATGGGGGGSGGQQLASRLQDAGFGGGAADLRSRGADLGLPSTFPSDLTAPRTWLNSVRSAGLGGGLGLGEGLGIESSTREGISSGIGGGGGRGGGAGGGGLGSIFGSLRGAAGSGFGLGGPASGGPPDLMFSGLGGFGGSGGPRPPDFGVPIAIAAVSPFAALLGKVVKDRVQNN